MTSNTRRGRGCLHISRRELVSGGLAVAAGLCAPAVSRAARDSFRFGLTPVFLTNDLELLDKLRSYLSKKMGGPIELVTRRTYQEITALVLSGQVHSAWICGYPYVQYRSELDLVATPLWLGRPLYQSYLIVGRDRPVDNWTGLRGDIHAFSDPNSNSGFLVTRTLLAKNGLLPEQFFSSVFFTYGHRNVIRAVSKGLAQSGSVDGYVWEVVRQTEPALVEGTKVIRRSEWLGFPPIASAKALAGDERVSRFQDALVTMNEDAEGNEVLEMLRLDGFAVTEASLFDPIAAKMEFVRQFG